MRRDTRRLFRTIGIELDPGRQGRRPVGVAGPAHGDRPSGLVRRARRDHGRADLVALRARGAAPVRLIDELRAKGVAVIYISHKLEEVMTISDEVSIMRDGRMIGTWPTPSLTIDQVITRMVGRELTDRFPDAPRDPGDVLLEVRRPDLAACRARSGTSRSELHRGEVLGIGGLVGAQRTELVEAIFGLRTIASGDDPRSTAARRSSARPSTRSALGMALLTEDRRDSGRGPTRSVFENVILAHLPRYANRLGHRGHEGARRATRDACWAGCASGRRRSRRRSRACREATSRRCCSRAGCWRSPRSSSSTSRRGASTWAPSSRSTRSSMSSPHRGRASS